MDHTQQQIAELTLELCLEAIAHRCATGKITVNDFTLYAETLKTCEFSVQYYREQQSKNDQQKREETPW